MNHNLTLKVCIAIPTINEENNLKVLIPDLRNLFPNAYIVIIDDGSTDETYSYITQLMRTDPNLLGIYRNERLGIGSAHLFAMDFAITKNFGILITMDGDLTHSAKDAYKLFDAIQDNDIVIGSRYLQPKSIEGWSWLRIALTHGGHLITKLFFGSNIDMSSGLRAYRVSQIPFKSIQMNCSENYEFFFTSILVFIKHKLKIAQVGVLLGSRGSGKSKMDLGLMFRGIVKLFEFGLRLKRVKI